MGKPKYPKKGTHVTDQHNEKLSILRRIFLFCKQQITDIDSNTTYNDKRYNKRQIIGTLTSIIFTAILDVIFIWPESHEIAFGVGVAYLVLQCIETTSLTNRQATIVSVFICLIAIIGYHFVPPTLPSETETHRWFVPASDPTPPNLCDPVPRNSMLILFGKTGFWTSSDLVRVELDDCLIAEIYRVQGRIVIGANVFTRDGKLVALIKNENDEFHLVPSQISYQERKNRSTLAVYDLEGKEIFYAHYANPHTFIVRGTFFCSEMRSLIIEQNGTTILNTPMNRDMEITNTCIGGTPFGVRFTDTAPLGQAIQNPKP
jgi:hypothetical protein